VVDLLPGTEKTRGHLAARQLSRLAQRTLSA
jgi:hypothetical protein